MEDIRLSFRRTLRNFKFYTAATLAMLGDLRLIAKISR